MLKQMYKLLQAQQDLDFCLRDFCVQVRLGRRTAGTLAIIQLLHPQLLAWFPVTFRRNVRCLKRTYELLACPPQAFRNGPVTSPLHNPELSLTLLESPYSFFTGQHTCITLFSVSFFSDFSPLTHPLHRANAPASAAYTTSSPIKR